MELNKEPQEDPENPTGEGRLITDCVHRGGACWTQAGKGSPVCEGRTLVRIIA